jgi:AcrR family transcriptional regulator
MDLPLSIIDPNLLRMNGSTVGGVPTPVKKPRRYDTSRRAAQAAETRRLVLVAARELFVDQGYRPTTVSQIAERAGVAVDTVYASVGRKAQVLRDLVETSLSGTDQAVPAEERDYVQAVRAATEAAAKIAIYARAVAQIHPRLAPVFLALRDAAATEPECAALWTSIAERRAANMRLFAADLRATGDLREDLSDDEVADIVWSMNAVEYWVLLVNQRGWSPERFGEWLTDAWTRLLLSR